MGEHKIPVVEDIWNDADVGIDWPLVDDVGVNLSDKDLAGKPFTTCETFE